MNFLIVIHFVWWYWCLFIYFPSYPYTAYKKKWVLTTRFDFKLFFNSKVFFYIARSTIPDENLLLNQNLSIIIISRAKIISIKYFCIPKKNWRRNPFANKQTIKHMFLPSYLIYIYIYMEVNSEKESESIE